MKIYLAGPMSNLPSWNFPAFHAAAAKLRSLGHEVFNPAEIDGGDTSQSWEYYMRKDIVLVAMSEAIAVLPGWEKSRGATLEVYIARKLGMPVLDAETLAPISAAPDKKCLCGTTTKTFKHPRVALTGYARAGKDAIGSILQKKGYKRVAFGDIIKRQVDPIVRIHFGFSAFTEIDAEKRRIRGTLEHWGEDNYDAIFREFFDTLPDVAVNTRLVRAQEAAEWVRRGGIIVHVERPGHGPETDFAERMNREMIESGLIHSVIFNQGTLADLEVSVEKSLFT
jgi:hypothetical protein